MSSFVSFVDPFFGSDCRSRRERHTCKLFHIQTGSCCSVWRWHTITISRSTPFWQNVMVSFSHDDPRRSFRWLCLSLSTPVVREEARERSFSHPPGFPRTERFAVETAGISWTVRFLVASRTASTAALLTEVFCKQTHVEDSEFHPKFFQQVPLFANR